MNIPNSKNARQIQLILLKTLKLINTGIRQKNNKNHALFY